MHWNPSRFARTKIIFLLGKKIICYVACAKPFFPRLTFKQLLSLDYGETLSGSKMFKFLQGSFSIQTKTHSKARTRGIHQNVNRRKVGTKKKSGLDMKFPPIRNLEISILQPPCLKTETWILGREVSIVSQNLNSRFKTRT